VSGTPRTDAVICADGDDRILLSVTLQHHARRLEQEIDVMRRLLQEVYDWRSSPINWSLPDDLRDRIEAWL
jgi:hypothetical protein